MALLSPSALSPHGSSRVEGDDEDYATQQLEVSNAEVRLFCNPSKLKAVRAIPMAFGDYMTLRCWRPDPQDDLKLQGYLVECPEMGPANHGAYENFIAWVSKDSFDRLYELAGTAH